LRNLHEEVLSVYIFGISTGCLLCITLSIGTAADEVTFKLEHIFTICADGKINRDLG